MNHAAFCYLGLLKLPEQLEKNISLLAEPEQSALREFLKPVAGLSKPELLRRWRQLRETEIDAASAEAERRNGASLERLAPSIQQFFLRREAAAG